MAEAGYFEQQTRERLCFPIFIIVMIYVKIFTLCECKYFSSNCRRRVGSESPCRAELPCADLHSLFVQIHPR